MKGQQAKITNNFNNGALFPNQVDYIRGYFPEENTCNILFRGVAEE